MNELISGAKQSVINAYDLYASNPVVALLAAALVLAVMFWLVGPLRLARSLACAGYALICVATGAGLAWYAVPVFVQGEYRNYWAYAALALALAFILEAANSRIYSRIEARFDQFEAHRSGTGGFRSAMSFGLNLGARASSKAAFSLGRLNERFNRHQTDAPKGFEGASGTKKAHHGPGSTASQANQPH